MSASSTLASFETFRQRFPTLTHKAYFNYGGQGTLPQEAIDAILRTHTDIQQAGPFSIEVNRWINRETDEVKQAIAHEFNVTPNTITLTEAVSVGCNIPLWGINWREGDHLLMSDCEHQGIIAIVEEIQRRFGIKVSTCPIMETLNGGDPVAVIAQHLRPTTRLLVISHILWNTGQVLPLADIVRLCHGYPTHYAPIQVLVDAAQSVGVLPLNLAETEVDFYAFTGHKWWCGPAGLGGLYVRPEAMHTIQPTYVGWRGITKDARGYPTGWVEDGRRFEVATSDFTLYPALRAAIATHRQWGSAEERYQRICTLSAYLWQRLSEVPGVTCLRTTPPEAGLVSFQVQSSSPSIHTHWVTALEAQGFLLRTLQHPDCIRACVHYFTLESEIDRLIEAMQALAST